MTLAQRILLSISALVLLVTVTLTVAVRRAWEATALEQFSTDFGLATTRLREQLADELAQLPAQLEPLCRHSQMVDSTLTDLQAGKLDRERKYALSLLVPATLEAFAFDELILVTGDGEILGAHRPSLVGSVDRALAQKTEDPAPPILADRDGQWRIEAHCRKARSGRAVALYAARYLDSLFERVGALHGLRLSRQAPDDRPERFTRQLALPELRGTPLFASPRRMTLDQAVAQLNLQIVQWSALVLIVALLLGFWFARRLARPIVELSEQARLVVEGQPRPIVARGGGTELREFADSFNRTLGDLVKLRQHIAAVERVAAQREIARRVAHEIKNPLAPIRAAIETLRRLRGRNDPAFDDYFDEATQTVLAEVRRIATIVREFTEFARLPPPKPAWFDVDHMVRSVVQLHQGDDVRLEVNSPGSIQLRADRDQCVQVVTNLLQNAIDAAAGAGAHVQVGVQTTGDHIVLRIEDNGPGIGDEMRAQVFKPYVTTKKEGTGLGLAIAQRIVLEHAGAVWVERSALGGAAFVVSLPVDGPAVVPEGVDP